MSRLRTVAVLLAIGAMPLVSSALDLARAERLFSQHCAVCHGADRGGYIGPALNSDETKLSRGEVAELILSGRPPTLMPQHPSWRGALSVKDRDLLAELVTTRPKSKPTWGIDDVRKSLQVLVADESTLPRAPRYKIDRIDDLMAVMSRGRQAAGKEAKVLFFDGTTHRKVGEVATGYAPHLMDFHPTEPRWAYVRDDVGYVHKIDLYSMRTVRRVRAGLNGTSLAVSRDGRYVAAGSYVPHTMVILDASTLEPLHLIELSGVDPDGKMVEADSGMITATPFANWFVVALEQAGQVWIVDLDRRGMPITAIKDVGRHLHDAFLSPDGRYLVVASYDDHLNAVIDLAEARIVRKIPAGCQPHLGSGAVVQSNGRLLGIGTNIGEANCKSFEVTVFDMNTFDVVKRIPVVGPTESPAAHPNAPYIAVDIVGTGPNANKIQFIDKNTLDVVRTIEVLGPLGHSHFPEYTARGDFVYVSARYRGDRSMGTPGGRLVIYDARMLEEVKSIAVDVPAGVFSRVRARSVVVGMQQPAP
jgi:mono/diheme cytochrome c family protein/DNA-binding beta-propeller fold protein YncE